MSIPSELRVILGAVTVSPQISILGYTVTNMGSPASNRLSDHAVLTAEPYILLRSASKNALRVPLRLPSSRCPDTMAHPKLFTPIKVGGVELQHRVVMSPMTRDRADKNHIPTPMMAEYYAQRASTPGTLLISEATFIAPQAGGHPHVPGIWNDEQVAGWQRVRPSHGYRIDLCLISCSVL